MRTKEELMNIARLAKLSVEIEDMETMYNELTDMLKIVETIKDVDLAQYDCTETLKTSDLREDEVKASLPVELILSDAAKKHDDFFTA